MFTLLETVFTLKFCRITFEKFGLKKKWYGNGPKSKYMCVTLIV